MTDTPVIPDVEQLALLRQVIRDVARSRRLSPEDVEDFDQSIQLRLHERDGDIFRRFTGRSSLRTYLRVVVNRLLLDWLNSQRGKWRPSAAAKRLGPHACLLERLIHRDGCSQDQAIEIVGGHSHAPSRLELRDLVDRLPTRTPRPRRLSEEALAERGVPFDDPIEVDERRRTVIRQRRALAAAIRRLGVRDRQLLKFRYRDGRSVQSIAVLLGVDAKSLHRRFERVIGRLRRSVTLCAAAAIAPDPGGQLLYLREIGSRSGRSASRSRVDAI